MSGLYMALSVVYKVLYDVDHRIICCPHSRRLRLSEAIKYAIN
jgi:hypothetical protein